MRAIFDNDLFLLLNCRKARAVDGLLRLKMEHEVFDKVDLWVFDGQHSAGFEHIVFRRINV